MNRTFVRATTYWPPSSFDRKFKGCPAERASGDRRFCRAEIIAVAALILLLAGVSGVGASVEWGGPGWYVIDEGWGELVAGPLANQRDCETDAANEPKADFLGGHIFTCHYFQKESDMERTRKGG